MRLNEKYEENFNAILRNLSERELLLIHKLHENTQFEPLHKVVTTKCLQGPEFVVFHCKRRKQKLPIKIKTENKENAIFFQIRKCCSF